MRVCVCRSEMVLLWGSLVLFFFIKNRLEIVQTCDVKCRVLWKLNHPDHTNQIYRELD